ncbi:MAG: S1 RNA-binding domain-containing protein [Ruminococcus sp.]|nr:S1 RNA-binding domain-containing protein [Ruminococcus sp.]
MSYRPEGMIFQTKEDQRLISSLSGLKEAMEKGEILEAPAAVCTGSHDLIVELPCGKGIIPREEGAIGIREGTARDIALISRVGKIVAFKVTEVSLSPSGQVAAVLSRRKAQEECLERYADKLLPGDVIGAKVTHLEKFGCFVDIGCGVPSLIPIDMISVSRISHPSDRFTVGQDIRAVVRSRDGHKLCLSHKELLGTWEENAAFFSPGETVSGVVRSVEGYGIFVELMPNLAGLAELRPGVEPGDRVSVYIKAVIPEKMKIKLIIVDKGAVPPQSSSLRYFVSERHMDTWRYSTPSCAKVIETVF